MIYPIKTLIKTDKSFLNIYSFNMDDDLKKLCIDEINENLIIDDDPNKTNNRSVCIFSDVIFPFTMFNKSQTSIQFTPNIQKIVEIINNYFNSDFNGILVNKYNDGNDFIHIHSDAKTGIHPIGIITISLGETRNLSIYDKNTYLKVIDIPTKADEIILMGGDFQDEFSHGISIEKNIKNPRYSITFRKYKTNK